MQDIIPTRTGVLADFTVYSQPIDKARFTNLLRFGEPNSYFSFQKYYPGDYAYEKAKFKIRLKDPSMSIEELGISIDVPDIIDSGIIETDPDVNLHTTVQFTKSFNITPDINAIVLRVSDKKQFQNAFIEFFEINKDEFKFKLSSRTSTDNILGEISWIARGY